MAKVNSIPCGVVSDCPFIMPALFISKSILSVDWRMVFAHLSIDSRLARSHLTSMISPLVSLRISLVVFFGPIEISIQCIDKKSPFCENLCCFIPYSISCSGNNACLASFVIFDDH